MAKPRTSRRKDPWSRAVEHLRGADPDHWAPLIDRIGPCQLRPRPDRFGTLVRSIIGQQISTRAAAAIDARLRAMGGDPHHPERLLALGEADFRAAGLSSTKARAVLDLAGTVARGDAPLDALDHWDDDAIVARLTTIKGIGVWTAEMFLIFALNRPDILPVSDLGVRAGIRDFHGLDELPGPQQCRALAEPWRPYRSVASWYLWRRADAARQAKP